MPTCAGSTRRAPRRPSPPREAARLALRLAEETDARVASLPPAKLWPLDPSSLINPLRAAHRGEHLDEIEAALGRQRA